jgi:rSAM/selenodomain-associated transferase 2
VTIAVVIPTLNEERSLPRTLARAASLGFDHLVVVDGGSTDQTRKIVQFFAHSPQTSALTMVRLVTSPPGRSEQMNQGANESQGDVLLFLHADTELPTNAKQAIEQALQDPLCVGGRFDVRFDRPSLLGTVISTLMNLRSRWSGIATGDQAIFVRRAIFDRLGGFAEIPLMEDVEFTTRLKRAGRVAALRETVTTSYRRWESYGPERTILLMWALRLLYWIGVSPHRLGRWYGMAR